MHNDEPTLLDSLDRGALIAEVGNAVAQCTPPQVFGVHGDWGLGKTSFLHQVQWYLTGDCPQQSDDAKKEMHGGTNSAHYDRLIRSVWFDAWRYQHEDAPVVALLQEMHAQLSWGHQIAKVAKRSVETSVRGALLSIEELTKKIGFQYSKFRDANREWEVKNLATSLPSHVLREHLMARALVAKPSTSFCLTCGLCVKVLFWEDLEHTGATLRLWYKAQTGTAEEG